MHDVQRYQVVGKLKDYGRTIHSQSEVRLSKLFNCIMCVHMYVYACIYHIHV